MFFFKKIKIFSPGYFRQEEKSFQSYLPTHSRLKSFRSMFLVTFLTVNRSRAIWFKWYLTFFPAVRTCNRVHLSRWTIKTLSSSANISFAHHIIPPCYYSGLLLFKYLQKALDIIWTRLCDSFMENSSNCPFSLLLSIFFVSTLNDTAFFVLP